MTPQDPEVEALQQDIERTRAQLGDTVEALAAKADIKGRAERAASQAAAQARQTARDAAKQIRATASDAVWQAATSARDAVKRAAGVGRRWIRGPVPAVLAGAAVVATAVVFTRRPRRRLTKGRRRR